MICLVSYVHSALGRAARQEDAPLAGMAPYKGLLFFDETDAALFFGRETLTAQLADRVTNLATEAALRFLAVVGASGSGKSSLVRAGLAVRSNAPAGLRTSSHQPQNRSPC